MEPVEVGLWSAGRTALALVVYLLCLWPVWCISLEGQATFRDILWTRTCATGWFYDFEFGAFGYLVRRMGSRPLGVGVVVHGCGLGGTV